MPAFNGTGPNGQGPMTGWGRGSCGGGRRGFFDFGRRFWGRSSQPENSKNMLKARLKDLEDEKSEIESMLKTMEKDQ